MEYAPILPTWIMTNSSGNGAFFMPWRQRMNGRFQPKKQGKKTTREQTGDKQAT